MCKKIAFQDNFSKINNKFFERLEAKLDTERKTAAKDTEMATKIIANARTKIQNLKQSLADKQQLHDDLKRSICSKTPTNE